MALSAKHKKFCTLLVFPDGDGKYHTATSAYKAVYGDIATAKQTAYRLLQNPEVQAYLKEQNDEMLGAIKHVGICSLVNRLQVAQQSFEKLLQVIEERAAKANPDVPGDSTGLLVRKIKKIGVGSESQMVSDYEVDTGLLSELRALRTEVDEILENRAKKLDLTSGGEPVKYIVGVDLDQI